MFNLFNRKNFNTWRLQHIDPTYGQPTATGGIAYDPLVIVFGFRAPSPLTSRPSRIPYTF